MTRVPFLRSCSDVAIDEPSSKVVVPLQERRPNHIAAEKAQHRGGPMESDGCTWPSPPRSPGTLKDPLARPFKAREGDNVRLVDLLDDAASHARAAAE
jgi:hypothetical protein